MNPSLVKAWAADLRSGKFRQAGGTLHRVKAEGRTRNERAGYCCLGVLSTRIRRLNAVKATGWKWDGEAWRQDGHIDFTNHLPLSLLKAIGMTMVEQRRLVNANDAGSTFEQLADRIERMYLGGAT